MGLDRALLRVVDAAYELDAPIDDWLLRLVGEARPALDRGLGVMGVTFTVVAGRVELTSRMVTTDGVPPEAAELAAAGSPQLPANEVAATFASPRALDSGSEAFHREYPGQCFSTWPRVERMRQLGVHDQLVAKGLDPIGIGCMLVGNVPHEMGVEARAVRSWACVMAHVLAGLRLRGALATPAEAVLDPGGRLLHAEGAATPCGAREALREAAIRIDRAKSKRGRADPVEALSSWRALVAGRWSLVDSFEKDGRRYLMARRNDPRLGFPRELSQRQRQIVAYAALGHSNKFIAYTLGLAPSTVATHLADAMGRLGARTRCELTRMWMPNDPGRGINLRDDE